ncbi:MAG: hypothetical protein ACREU4_14070, partial [Burkholderiales bacterium]
LLLGALTHTAQHKLGIEHQHSRAGRGRARYAHRVGSRKRGVSQAEELATPDRAEDIVAGADEPAEAPAQEPWF